MGRQRMLSRIVVVAVVGVAVGLTVRPAGAAGSRHRSFVIPHPTSQPFEITMGPDGNMWFTESRTIRVARITPQGRATEFAVSPDAFPDDIAPGPDGNVWFTEGANGKIGMLTPQGALTEITFSTFDAAGGISAGPDDTIWFTDQTGDRIWRLDIPTGALHSFPIPTANAFAGDIALGPDGNLWFTESDRIGRITPSGSVTEFGSGLPGPSSITAGPDGNVWFTERFAPAVVRVTPDGAMTSFPTPGGDLESITVGSDDNLWFTESADNRIARITTRGVVTEGPPVDTSEPTGISAGPGRSIWFLGFGSNTVYATIVPPGS